MRPSGLFLQTSGQPEPIDVQALLTAVHASPQASAALNLLRGFEGEHPPTGGYLKTITSAPPCRQKPMAATVTTVMYGACKRCSHWLQYF